MPDRLLPPSPESDTRFQYEIIKGLSESVRDLASSIRDMQSTQVGMLERLAKLEANRVSEVVAEVKISVDGALKRIDRLEKDKDRRDGAYGMLGTIKAWAPFLAMLFSAACVLWLYGRSAGIVPAPPTPVAIEQRRGEK